MMSLCDSDMNGRRGNDNSTIVPFSEHDARNQSCGRSTDRHTSDDKIMAVGREAAVLCKSGKPALIVDASPAASAK